MSAVWTPTPGPAWERFKGQLADAIDPAALSEAEDVRRVVDVAAGLLDQIEALPAQVPA